MSRIRGRVMARYKDGEYIYLFRDEPGPEYIRGHVSLEKAKEIIANSMGAEFKVISIRPTYAFFGVAVADGGEPCQVFLLRDSPGRGRFPVTECEVKFEDFRTDGEVAWNHVR